MEFLNKLYSINNFGLYLIIAIIILVILFIVIMIFGKKDKKEREIEATAKLQQLNAENTFKEDSNINSVEVNGQPQMQNDTIVIPVLEEAPKFTATNKAQEVQEEVQEEIELPKLETPVLREEVKEEIEMPKVAEPVEPVLEKVEEKPLVLEEAPTVEVNEAPEVPIFNYNEVINSDKPEVNKNSDVKEETSFEEDGIELPALKKADSKAEDILERTKDIKPIQVNDYNLDNISGETYTINK